MFMNAARLAKSVNIFFRKRFPIYGTMYIKPYRQQQLVSHSLTHIHTVHGSVSTCTAINAMHGGGSGHMLHR